MKNTGIVRKVDELGRIVLPVELRRTLNIDIKDPLEIYTDNGGILLRPYARKCQRCGQDDMYQLVENSGICLCKKCIGIFVKNAQDKG